MHALPRLSALNWLRLALIPPGSDWRAIPETVRLAERSGRPNGPFGVERWEGSSHAVLGHTNSRDTWGSIADPRVGCRRREGGHGVRPWDGQSAAVIGHPSIDNFPAQVADPRIDYRPHRGCIGVAGWDASSRTVRGTHNVNNTTGSLADPRPVAPSHIVDRSDAPTVLGPPLDLGSRTPLHVIIAAADGTWHRPMTTLELAALQGFPTALGGQPLELDGKSHAGWRERIGNAVPPPTAFAIAQSCAATLAAAAAGEWTLDGNPIWVREQLRRAEARSWAEVAA